MQQNKCERLIAGRKIAFDDEGFLVNFEDWSEQVFEVLCKECGLCRLLDKHRQVVGFLREFYAYNGRAPLNSALRKGTGLALMEMESLFPGGLKHGARRLAGLPNPKTCD